MTQYGPATGHFSSQSVRTARKTGGKGGSRIVKTSNGWNYIPDPTGEEARLSHGYGGSSNGNGYYNSYRGLLDRQLRAQQDAINKQTQATVDSIELYRPKINQDYEKQQKENYIANTKNQSQIGDYMNAMGYSGGLAESTLAKLNNTYQDNRATADTEKNNAMLQIDQQVAQARSTGDASLASAMDNYYTNYQNALQHQEQMDYQKQIQAKNDYANTIGAYSDDYKAQINKLLDMGVSEDDYRIKYLNAARNGKITDRKEAQAATEQQELENQYKKQNLALKQQQVNQSWAKINKPKSRKSSTRKYTPSQVQTMYENGWIDEQKARAMLDI